MYVYLRDADAQPVALRGGLHRLLEHLHHVYGDVICLKLLDTYVIAPPPSQHLGHTIRLLLLIQYLHRWFRVSVTLNPKGKRANTHRELIRE